MSSATLKPSSSVPKSPAASSCVVCGIKAKLVYQCKKCGEERRFCASFVCQAENWDSHQLACNVPVGASVVLEDTLIKHISGGLSWSRSRKISISTSDIAEAMRNASEPLSFSPPVH